VAEMVKYSVEPTVGQPEGFKMTELGPLPEEWEVARLKEIAKFTKRPKGLVLGKQIAFVPMELIPDDASIKPGCRLIRPNELKSGTYCEPGDVLVAKITPCFENGKQAIVPDDHRVVWFTSTEVFPLKANPQFIERNFLFYYLRLPDVRQEIAAKMEGTTGRQRIPKQVFANHLVPLPPLYEQRAIAHVLRTVQRAKEATERVIQTTRELKKSLMRYLFTYGPVPIEEADRVSLKETEIGLLPEHWEVVRLGEVADIKGGKRLPKGHKLSDRPTPYPYIRVVDFKDGSVDKTNLKYLTPQDYENIKQYTISSRDVYISIAGTIGLVGIVPPELDGANLTENAAKIVLRDQAKVDPHFLVYFLASEIGQEQILIRTTKTSQPKLALARIRQIPIPYPSAGEQQEIARILKVVDKKLQAEEARKQGLEELFKTLLHNLMTGKIRVKDLNLYNTEEVM